MFHMLNACKCVCKIFFLFSFFFILFITSILIEAGHDFCEGVQAIIVGIDHKPKWNSATLIEVTPDMVLKHFAPVPEELKF